MPEVSTSGGFNNMDKTKEVPPISKPYKNPPAKGGNNTRNNPKKFISIGPLSLVVLLIVDDVDNESDSVSTVRIESDSIPGDISIIIIIQRRVLLVENDSRMIVDQTSCCERRRQVYFIL
mmetsp:Transcript_20551/g.51103  ORF Transcript_20551/g.51103 Transcript_20551/m.51103 type:complete len:120 (+) Transcript_20551:1577-1936(+)